MEEGDSHPKSTSRRNPRCFILCVVAVIVVIVVVVLVLGLTLGKKQDFKHVFISRCETLKENDCQKLWTAFEQAYVGKDPCKVPPEAYNTLIAAAPMKAECNRMMFWSKTEDIVRYYTSKRDCQVTLANTLLGSVLDDLKWCGKEGSNETITTGCQTNCNNNPVRSFWRRASAEYAKLACGEVTVMLSGSIIPPFNPTSIFATDEVKHFNPAIMNILKVVLVTQKNGVFRSNCADPSLMNLQKELPKGIAYNCKEVAESQIKDCASHPEKPCGSCW